MLKKMAFVLSVLLAGAALGVGSAMLMIRNGAMIGRVENNHWFTSRSVGLVDADPYTRALVARIGLLGLNRQETVYFSRTEDGSGVAFDGACIYRVDGGPLAARWWSITLYAADNFLALNDDDQPSIDATSVRANADGSWTARIAPGRGDAQHWISSRNGAAFSLSIRLYNPEPAVGEHLEDVALPTVTREGCEGAGR